MFKHFIITRYNIKIDTDGFGKFRDTNDEDWMQHRFALFRDYCFPSVKNQTNKNFVWLIFLDADTKPVFREQISSLISAHGNFKAIYIHSYAEFFKTLRRVIRDEMNEERYLITSRLDNDDCISRDYIELIQSQFQNQNKCIIDFPHGLSLEIEPGFRLAKRKITMNPFISLIEKSDSFHTVMYYFGHRQWKNSGAEITTIRQKRTWMQVIHKYNVSNTFKGFWLTGGFDLAKKFGLPQSLQVHKPHVLSQMRQFLYAFLMRFKSRMS